MDALRKHVLAVLEGKEAHADFESAVKDFPAEKRGAKPPHATHTAWQLLEHLRIAQWDILEFSRNPNHVSPKWPDAYWPETGDPPDPHAWDKSIHAFQKDAKELKAMVAHESTDLLAPLPHGDGQTLLREALLVADHNAYHLGQLIMLRTLLGIWPTSS